MSLSPFLRLLAAASGVAVVSLVVSAARCDDEGDNPMMPELTCSEHGSDARLTRFVLYSPLSPGVNKIEMIQACGFDRQVEPAGDCSLIVWDFPNLGNTPNQIDQSLGGQTYFQYLTGQTCLSTFDGQIDYSLDPQMDDPELLSRHLFNGGWIRDFDTGTGPFAIGTYQIVDGGFNVLETGCFDFFEDADILVGDRVCQLPE